ncbi:MAG: nitrile hydratase subunit alpha [Hyphomicrobiaceae bacterium]
MVSHDSDKIAHIHRELHSHLPPEPGLRVKALETVLIEKGFLQNDTVDNWLENYAEKIGPKVGARVIARSWIDPSFEQTLRDDAMKAFVELDLAEEGGGYDLQAVFNSESEHNLVVCTLCSCYPLRLLGMSPAWYKSTEYRARAVRDPHGVLEEFGVELSDDVKLHVWDSTSERRFMVVPQRPPATDGWSEDDLANLVTRNSMIGTHRDLSPGPETR